MLSNLRDDPGRDLTRSPVFEAVMAGLGPQRSVLDIGAGPGRYTLALARAGCRVWALEPGGAMREALEADRARLPADAAARITVLEGAWPAARGDCPATEVALASLVIHFCPDAAGFLRAMDAAATRRSVLAIRAAQMQPLMEALWPRFHPERPYPRQPVLEDLLAVVEEVGLTPEVRVHPAVRDYGRYADRAEARRRAAGALGLERDEDLARLDLALDELLVVGGDGRVRFREPVREAVIAWAPGSIVPK